MPADPVPENSVTANNERQAEIEAMTEAISYALRPRLAGVPVFDPVRALMAAEAAHAALDRARDARHDDEGCATCGHGSDLHSPGGDYLCRGGTSCDCQFFIARSPQGEDHDADALLTRSLRAHHGIVPAPQNEITVAACGRCTTEIKHLRAEIERLSTPARDARPRTTTVEDVRAQTVAEIVALLRHNGEMSATSEARYFNCALADRIEREFAPDDTPHPKPTNG